MREETIDNIAALIIILIVVGITLYNFAYNEGFLEGRTRGYYDGKGDLAKEITLSIENNSTVFVDSKLVKCGTYESVDDFDIWFQIWVGGRS